MQKIILQSKNPINPNSDNEFYKDRRVAIVKGNDVVMVEQLQKLNFNPEPIKNEKINHCQKQIGQTEQWKKGLLQGMFV